MKLIAVTDDRQPINELANTIIAIKDEVDFVQIREKTKPIHEIITLLDQLQIGRVDKEKIIINDRLDLALLKDIPNLHLPENGIPVNIIKQRYPHIRIGCSVHSFEAAKEAQENGADYVLFGHCFETNSKKGMAPRGVEPIVQMKKELNIPVYGIGGITLDRVRVMRQSQVDGIAVMSSIFQAEKPSSITKKYRKAILI